MVDRARAGGGVIQGCRGAKWFNVDAFGVARGSARRAEGAWARGGCAGGYARGQTSRRCTRAWRRDPGGASRCQMVLGLTQLAWRVGRHESIDGAIRVAVGAAT